MESSLTQQEMDAVLQLIQLSGGDYAGDFQFLWLNFPAKKEGIKRQLEQEENREESVGETSSSSVINPAEKSLEEALPRRRKRVLPIAEIYRKTRPSINNRTLKSSQI